MNVPVVVSRDGDKEYSYDLYSRLLKERIIMIDGEIEPRMASIVVGELLYLQSEDDSKPISIYISSPGGMVSAGFSICSTMNLIKPPVYVTGHGSVASMASVILSCGEKGYRMILPNTRVMLHQVSAGAEGNVQDMRVSLKETERLNGILMGILAKNTGHTIEEINKATERDYYLDENEALQFGIVDKIIGNV